MKKTKLCLLGVTLVATCVPTLADAANDWKIVGRAAGAAGSPGSQLAVVPGTALEFLLAGPVSVDVVV
jgi:hypothetical protein